MQYCSYVVNNGLATISTAITILQIKAGAATPLEILRASLTQKGSVTSAVAHVALLRKSGAATVTSVTPLKLKESDPAAAAAGGTAATGKTGTAEGTNGDIIIRAGFNVISGWEYLPVPEERIFVPPAGIIAMVFLSAPASHDWEAVITFRESQ